MRSTLDWKRKHFPNNSPCPKLPYRSVRLSVSRHPYSPFPFITRSRLKAALMSARWLKACGELPSCSPLRAISSENMDRWFEKLRICYIYMCVCVCVRVRVRVV